LTALVKDEVSKNSFIGYKFHLKDEAKKPVFRVMQHNPVKTAPPD